MSVITFGKFIQTKRQSVNVSVSELARRAGLSKGYLHALENDIVLNVGLLTASRLCKAINVALSEYVALLEHIEPNEDLEPLGFDD